MFFKALSSTLGKKPLAFQLSLLLSLFVLIGLLFFLFILKTYYEWYYKKITSKEISLIREVLNPALIPYIITEDYASIEKYLYTIIEKTNIDHIDLINSSGHILLTITTEKNRPKVKYKPQEIFNNLQEEWREDEEYIRVLFPLRADRDRDVLAWLRLNYSKRDLKSLKKESFMLIVVLVGMGFFFLVILIRAFFQLIHKDLKVITQYLISIPQQKGTLLNQNLHSLELNDLKNMAERLSKLLSDQEKQILHEKYKLEEILSALTEGVVFTNCDLQINYTNEAFLKLIELQSATNITGMKLSEVLPLQIGNTQENFWENIDIYLKLREDSCVPHSLTFEELFYNPQKGQVKFLEASVINLENEIIEGYLFIFRDITQRKAIEKELQRIQKFEVLDRLAGGVAHDLRNLLAGLYNYLWLLKVKTQEEGSPLTTIFERIERLLNRASELSHQLLNLSKGGFSIKKAGNLVELIKEVADFCFSGFPAQIELKVNTPVENILFDQTQMAQVFQNLFLNAREAMPEGGKVTVEIDLKELKEEEIPPLNAGKYICISISDTGTGIPQEILPYIFDPFFTTKEKGTGLGLSIVFQIMRHHGGYITVSSEVGKGTTFYLYLPYELGEVEEEEEVTTSVEKKEGEGEKRILIVDDERDIREALKFILSDLGYEVDIAGSGEEAISKFSEAIDQGRPYNIVITDYTMPDIRGDKLLLLLREKNPNFTAILSTGYADIPAVSNYKQFGFDKILLKPYTVDQLLQMLRN